MLLYLRQQQQHCIPTAGPEKTLFGWICYLKAFLSSPTVAYKQSTNIGFFPRLSESPLSSQDKSIAFVCLLLEIAFTDAGNSAACLL